MKFDYKTKITLAVSSIALILIACAVSTVMLLINGSKPDIFSPPKDADDPHVTSATLSETVDYGQNYVNNIIFIGDTTIAKMVELDVLSYGSDTKQVWTGEDRDLALDFSIDKTAIVFPETGKALSIPDAAKEKKPDYLIITLGISNGVGFCTEENFKAYYGKLISSINEVSPDTKIILQSVFPVSKKYEKVTSGITAGKIDEANRWISELAQQKGIRYLDTASLLKDKDGYLREEYDGGDGLHLNADGYKAMLSYIRTHGYK